MSVVIAFVACGSGTGPLVRTTTQRIDDAAAAIARMTGTSAAEVKTTFRTTIGPASDEVFATQLEAMAAKPSWTTRAWTLAERTVALAQNEEVKFVSGLICDALEDWEQQRPVTMETLSRSAFLLYPITTEEARQRYVQAAASTLSSQDERDVEYVRWLRLTVCTIENLPE